MIFASGIFLVTLFLVIFQPKGIKIGTSALFGAFVSFSFGVVTFEDIIEVTSIVWDATLAFIGIIIFSMVLDKIGFFEWCAIKVAKLSNGNTHVMFILSLLLGSFVSALFANDGAALILTPILLAKMRLLRLEMKTIVVFLLAGGFISDSASLPFVFSNLTNIVTADYFHIGFIKYSTTMFFPFIVSVVISILVLWGLFYKELPDRVDINLLGDPYKAIKNKKLFYFSWFFLVLLLCGYIIGDIYGVPVSFFALGGATVFLLIASQFSDIDPKGVIVAAPWQIVWFSIGLYIVVYGLKNAGLTDSVKIVIDALSVYGESIEMIGVGFISAILSALMNNMPTIMIMDIATTHLPHLAYANIIGANLGPKMTPFGSLATLLWLHVLEQKGIKIGFWQYTKFGLVVTPVVLFVVLVSLVWSIK